jgi:uncharacterized RDD family membrane protein YckC
MREDYRLLTPENVELRFEVAGLGSRLLAATIDYSLIGIIETILFFGAMFAAVLASRVATALGMNQDTLGILGFTAYAILALVAFLFWWGYFILFELIWNGQTLGKRWLGLRVVRADGQPINATASFVRNLLRPVDLFFMIGALVMLFDRSSRRLGDIAAGTLVVHEPRPVAHDALKSVEIPSAPTALVDAIPNADRLTMAHYTILRDFFARRARMTPDRAAALAASLAADLARTLEVPASEVGEPQQFLASAAHAFEARHRYYDAPV